jgi:hypothetical protein
MVRKRPVHKPVRHASSTSSENWKPTFKVAQGFSQSESESRDDRRSVGQFVMVSSPIWGSWPDINCCLTFTVLSMSGAPSDERSGLSFVLVIDLSVNIYRFAYNANVSDIYIYAQYIQGLCQSSQRISVWHKTIQTREIWVSHDGDTGDFVAWQLQLQ